MQRKLVNYRTPGLRLSAIPGTPAQQLLLCGRLPQSAWQSELSWEVQ